MSQRNPDDTIEVDLDVDELDVTSAKAKPTYVEIKDYVWEKHNAKVSSLCIAQVKRKCGLEVGKNYNLPKTDDGRVRNCPQDKEKYIIEALEHFQAI